MRLTEQYVVVCQLCAAEMPLHTPHLCKQMRDAQIIVLYEKMANECEDVAEFCWIIRILFRLHEHVHGTASWRKYGQRAELCRRIQEMLEKSGAGS